MQGSRRGFAGLAMVALSAGMLFASPAFASVTAVDGIKYVARSYDVGAGDRYSRHDANCPKGTQTIGGGALNDLDFDTIVIWQTYPIDDRDRNSKADDGWGVLVKNLDGEHHDGKVFAICGDLAARYPTGQFSAGAHKEVNRDVACPGSNVVLSGGIRAGNKIGMNSTFPNNSEGWGSYVDNRSSKSQKWTEYAVCADLKTTLQDESFSLGPNSDGATNAECGLDHVYGVGFDTSGGFANVYANSLYPLSTVNPFDAGRAWINNFHDSLTFGNSVYAVCGPSL
jgi:hypothetical protein